MEGADFFIFIVELPSEEIGASGNISLKDRFLCTGQLQASKASITNEK
jgi:hypothetical protein